MKEWFISNDGIEYYDCEGEVYVLRYGDYNSEQNGYDGTFNHIELYSTLKSAEERIAILLKNRRNFFGFDIRSKLDVHYHDWGITYTATRKNDNDAFVNFYIDFKNIKSEPLKH